MIKRRAERAGLRRRLAQAVDRLGSLQLTLNPQTGKMEPSAEQERTVLEVAQTVRAVQELQRCSRETESRKGRRISRNIRNTCRKHMTAGRRSL